jgi:hypothetical protein
VPALISRCSSSTDSGSRKRGRRDRPLRSDNLRAGDTVGCEFGSVRVEIVSHRLGFPKDIVESHRIPVASLTPATAASMRSTFERPLADVCNHHALDLASACDPLSASQSPGTWHRSGIADYMRRKAREAERLQGQRFRGHSARIQSRERGTAGFGSKGWGRLLNEGASTGWAPGGLLDGYMAFGLSKCESSL